MNMPRFTAEASLYNVSARYRATAKAAVYGGLVQPAGSDVLSDPSGSLPVLSTELFHPDWPVWCFKRVCKDIAPAGQRPNLLCWQTIGIWNPVTARCE
jgi:hypothetical protein